jgi:putative serine protease PepD
MVKSLLPALCAALALLGATAADGAELKELAEQVRPSVVRLDCLSRGGEAKSSGTGFFISADGRLVTNAHVVDGCAGMTATLGDKTKLELEGLLATDKDHDLAILKAPAGKHPALALGSSEKIAQGDEVVVIGSPLGLAGTLSAGIVSAIREGGVPEMPETKKMERLLQLTAPISPGSSGSPVVDSEGSVVGVAVMASLGSAQNINFAVPVERVHALSKSIADNAQPKAFSTLPVGNLIASGVFFLVVVVGVGLALRRKR